MYMWETNYFTDLISHFCDIFNLWFFLLQHISCWELVSILWENILDSAGCNLIGDVHVTSKQIKQTFFMLPALDK